MLNNLKNSGFTLLEAITAIFLLTVGIGGISGLISQLITASNISSQRLIAAYLAQEGIEIVRNIRDTNLLQGNNWDAGLNNCQTGCEVDYTFTNKENPSLPSYDTGHFLNIDAKGFYSYSEGTPTIFKRKIQIIEPQSNIMEVKVEVSWEERGRSYQLTAQENLYNWR